jgi:transposase-like protein
MEQTKDNTDFLNMLQEFKAEENPLLAAYKYVLEQMMATEVSEVCNSEKGKHDPERNTSLSGKRDRRLDTGLGTINLQVPKVRKGGYIPFFITSRKRSDAALVSLVQEAYVNGVSTRKIEKLVKKLGVDGMSAGEVSNITRSLNEQVEEFRNRPLEKEYPVIWTDALYEKIRKNGKVISMAIIVIRAIDLDGNVHIIAIEPMYSESKETYSIMFNKLKERGLEKVWLVVSDAHLGLQAAIRKCFIGTEWQRCKTHFMRNIMAHVGAKHKKTFGAQIKQVWLQPDKEHAITAAKTIVDEYESSFPEAIKCLQNGLEDSLAFYDFPLLDSRKIASNNGTERANREIRRRSRVVGTFPSENSYMRLLVMYLIEGEDDNQNCTCYMNKENILEQRRLNNVNRN